MSTELTYYNAAKTAVALAKDVDEVKNVRDKAMAMRIYAQQARDKSLEEDCIEIRLRAERRLGEMMGKQEKAKPPGENQYVDRVVRKPEAPMTLAEAGIDKNLAHRARRFASMTPVEFEAALGRAKRAVTVALEVSKQATTQKPTSIQFLRQTLYTMNTNLHIDREARALLQQLRIRIDHLLASQPQPEQENVTWLNTTKN